MHAIHWVYFDGRPIVTLQKAGAHRIVVYYLLRHTIKALTQVILVHFCIQARIFLGQRLRSVYVKFLILIVIKLVLFFRNYRSRRNWLLYDMSGDRAHTTHTASVGQLV